MQKQYDIDRGNGSQPVYRQLSGILKDEIYKFYISGDVLPSEQQLAERFQVNRHTVRRAIEELIQVGYVNRVHGKGTFVRKISVDYAIHPATRFTETLESQGRRTISRVLGNCKARAHGKVASKLELSDGASVIHLRTMRVVDTTPFCVSDHFFPSPDFEIIYQSYKGGSLHRFIRKQCDTSFRRISSLVSASAPDEEDAQLLNLESDCPILKVKSVNVESVSGVPAEFVITRFRGDAIQLSIKP